MGLLFDFLECVSINCHLVVEMNICPSVILSWWPIYVIVTSSKRQFSEDGQLI